MLREQNASKLATVGVERTAAEKETDAAKLLALRRKEITQKMEKMKKYSGARYVKIIFYHHLYKNTSTNLINRTCYASKNPFFLL